MSCRSGFEFFRPAKVYLGIDHAEKTICCKISAYIRRNPRKNCFGRVSIRIPTPDRERTLPNVFGLSNHNILGFRPSAGERPDSFRPSQRLFCLLRPYGRLFPSCSSLQKKDKNHSRADLPHADLSEHHGSFGEYFHVEQSGS